MFNVITLPNGVRIVLERMPFVRSISLGLWVRNGSRNETAETNGISHFIEHMLFKGTENRTAKNIADEMDAIGGQLNAYTAKEYTTYYTRVLDNHFDIALDIFADMFFNSKFDDVEIEKERNVIAEEINMYKDTPEDLVHDIMQGAVWEDDALGFPILGTAESISGFNHKTFVDYYKNNYCPENTVIAVSGNFDEDVIIKKLEKYFLDFRRDSVYKPLDFKNSFKPSVVTHQKDIEQLHLCIAFPGVETGSAKTYDLAVLNTMFGGGMSSRLFQNVREDRGLAYSIYSYNSSYTKTGIMSIYAALNIEQAEEAIKLIIEETQKISAEKIDEKLLRNTKEQLKSNFLLSLESTSSRMTHIGRAELLLRKILTPDEIVAKIDSVTIDSIHELSNKMFRLKNLSLSAVGKIDGSGLDFSEMVKNVRK